MYLSRLSKKVIRSISIRVALVIILTSAISYWHLTNLIKKERMETLEKYVHARSYIEGAVPTMALNNHQIIKKYINEKLAEKINPENIKEFDRLLTYWPDGTIRNRKNIFDGTKDVGVFIPPHTVINDRIKNEIAIYIHAVQQFGRAYHNEFQNLYVSTPTNILILRWPETPYWTTEAKADFDMAKEEWAYIADKVHNPERVPKWTALYYDKVAKKWMSTSTTPVDDKDGKHIYNLSHDVMFDQLVTRTSDNHLDGTYNVVFRGDGRLIAHPFKQSELETSEGIYDIKSSKDEFLKGIYSAVTSNTDNKTIISHPSGQALLGVSKIHGPEWYYVTVYPISLIRSTTLSMILFVGGMAVLSLILEMFFLALVIQQEIAKPLAKFTATSDKIANGDFDQKINHQSSDELGILAKSFNIMLDYIFERDQLLKKQNDNLEKAITARTEELMRQKANLVESSRLASLGEMAGGIAHEINNPLAIIHGKAIQLKRKIEMGDLDLEKFKIDLGKIETTANRIAKIIKGLRSISRNSESDPKSATSIKQIIEETLDLCLERFKHHGIEFKLNCPEDHTIECRPSQIAQILINLLGNAHDAVENTESPWVELQVELKETFLKLSVTDSGSGIKSELADKIMQPFFTTKEVGKGTGLGLSISKGIAEEHGGKLYYDTNSSHTRFILEIPYVQKT